MPTFVSDQYMSKLRAYMKEQFEQYTKVNESKNIFKAARTPITLLIVIFTTYVAYVSKPLVVWSGSLIITFYRVSHHNILQGLLS